MAVGRIPRRRNDRRGSFLYAPALGKLEAWLALPRELALGRLAYALKRPLFTLPQAPWRWHEHPPAAAALVPPDPWPGNAPRGVALLDHTFHFHPPPLPRPAPLTNPVGVDRPWLDAGTEGRR